MCLYLDVNKICYTRNFQRYQILYNKNLLVQKWIRENLQIDRTVVYVWNMGVVHEPELKFSAAL